MLIRAKLGNRGSTLGFCSVDEGTQVIQYEGVLFIHDATTERITDVGRRVQYIFKMVTTDIAVVKQLHEDF